MEEVYHVVLSKPGIVVPADGSKLILRVVIVGIKSVGFSPFGGINFIVKTAGGVVTSYVPDELKNSVKDKPLSPPDKLPEDGWELIDIQNQEPAVEEAEVEVEGKKYKIKVLAEASMISRNMNYKTDIGEPIYWVHWAVKIQWKNLEVKTS